jgi:peptidoglycan/xylan/chitin deacetylase (PgdA/CDA1 family)
VDVASDTRRPAGVLRLARRGLRRADALAAVAHAGLAHRRAARRSGGVILGYHSISEARPDPTQLSLPPADFADHVALLAAEFRPMTVEALLDASRRGTLPKRAIAVTFDDGYVDNLRVAGPVLRDAGVPAMVFVATSQLETGGTWWWRELETILLGPGERPARLRVRTGGASRELLTATEAEREAAYYTVGWALREGSPELRAEVLAHLRAWSAPDPALLAALPRAMTAQELAELESFHIEVGGHGHDHVSLRARPAAAIRADVARCRAVLQDRLDRPVRGFAYPFGDRSLVARSALADNDFAWAAGVHPAMVGDRSDPLHLARFVIGHQDAATLERQLATLFAGGRP